MSLHYTTVIPLSVNSVMMPYVHTFLVLFFSWPSGDRESKCVPCEMTLSSLRICLEAGLQFLMRKYLRESKHMFCVSWNYLDFPGMTWCQTCKKPHCMPGLWIMPSAIDTFISVFLGFTIIGLTICFLGRFLTLSFSAQEPHFLTPSSLTFVSLVKLSPLYVASSEEAGVFRENVNTRNIGHHFWWSHFSRQAHMSNIMSYQNWRFSFKSVWLLSG